MQSRQVQRPADEVPPDPEKERLSKLHRSRTASLALCMFPTSVACSPHAVRHRVLSLAKYPNSIAPWPSAPSSFFLHFFKAPSPALSSLSTQPLSWPPSLLRWLRLLRQRHRRNWQRMLPDCCCCFVCFGHSCCCCCCRYSTVMAACLAQTRGSTGGIPYGLSHPTYWNLRAERDGQNFLSRFTRKVAPLSGEHLCPKWKKTRWFGPKHASVFCGSCPAGKFQTQPAPYD